VDQFDDLCGDVPFPPAFLGGPPRRMGVVVVVPALTHGDQVGDPAVATGVTLKVVVTITVQVRDNDDAAGAVQRQDCGYGVDKDHALPPQRYVQQQTPKDQDLKVVGVHPSVQRVFTKPFGDSTRLGKPRGVPDPEPSSEYPDVLWAVWVVLLIGVYMVDAVYDGPSQRATHRG